MGEIRDELDLSLQILEQLRVQIAERDAEIAGLRSALADTASALADATSENYMREVISVNERDAEIAALRQHVDAWQATGNAIMQCAVGREAPLSDSDVCGEINALRQQVAELQAWKDAVPVRAILWYFDVSEFSQAIVNTNTVMQIDYNTALDKWHRDMVKEVIDV